MNALIVHYGPGPDSYTQESVAYVKQLLQDKGMLVNEQDLAAKLPGLYSRREMAAYINRNFLKKEVQPDETNLLASYDEYAKQLIAADFLVLAFPIYNFSMPAAVKAWIDAVAQPRQTFKYGMYGSEGLLKANKALVLISSGSTRIGSSRDFASPYIEYALKFMGIKEVSFTGATGTKLMQDREKLMNEFKQNLANQLKDLV